MITCDHTGILTKQPSLGHFAGSSGGRSSVAVRAEDADTLQFAALGEGSVLRKMAGQTSCLGQIPADTKVERTVGELCVPTARASH